MQRRIRIAAASTAILTSVALGGCSSPSPNATEDVDEPVSLLLPSGAFERTMNPILEKFTADTGIEVDAVAMPAEDARSRQVLDLANQTGDIDLILMQDVAWMSQIQNSLEPLNDLIDDDEVDIDDYIPELVSVFEADGNQYALPFGLSPRVFVYREDVLKNAGIEIPKTFDELEQAAAALTTADQYGLTAPLGGAGIYVQVWMQLGYSAGMGDVLVDGGTKAGFNDAGGVRALELLSDIYQSGGMPQDAIEMQHDGVLVAMQTGRSAMAILPSTFLGLMNDPEASPYAGQFHIAPFPTSDPSHEARYVVGGWGYGISKFSNNKKNTWELEKYLIDYFQYPPEDADVEQLLRPQSNSAFSNSGTAKVFPGEEGEILRKALTAAETGPSTPRWSAVEEILARHLQVSFLGQATAQEALDAAEIEVNELLEN